jgi:hypothetical protein
MKAPLRLGGWLPFLFTLPLVFQAGRCWGGGPELEWARLIPNDCGASSFAAVADAAGNVYVASGPQTALSKYDPAGNLLWTWGRQEGDCAGHIWARAISVDATGSIYVSGGVWGAVQVGDFRHAQTSPSAFFAKLSPDRTLLFAKFADNLYWEQPFLRTEDGQYVLGGSIPDSGPFTYEGISMSASGWPDLVVIKVDANGAPVWARRGMGDGQDQVDGLACAGSGELFVAGNTMLSTGFAMGSAVTEITANRTLLLVALNAAGDAQWIKSVASPYDPTAVGEPWSSAVAYSPQTGAVFWAGDFTDSLNLTSPAIPSAGGRDVFVARLTREGTTSWAKTFGGTNNQYASALAIGPGGHMYVAGIFFGKITIGDDTFTSRGKEDIFVANLREDGTPIWAKQIGYAGEDRVYRLAFTPAGDLLVVGSVGGGFLVDGQFLQTTGGVDGFIAKFKSEGLPPVFLTQPESSVVSAGMTLVLRAEASSPIQPLRYQWWFNGAPVPGETNSSLTLSQIQSGQAGSYYVVAENAVQAVPSRVAVVTFTDASTLVLGMHPSLQIFGTTGRAYRIEYATETRTAAQWTVLTNLTLQTSPQLWVDQDAAVGSRFYRVLLQPPP